MINIHNFYAKYAKILDMCKEMSKNIVDNDENIPR